VALSIEERENKEIFDCCTVGIYLFLPLPLKGRGLGG
jgi:hypothetical protein